MDATILCCCWEGDNNCFGSLTVVAEKGEKASLQGTGRLSLEESAGGRVGSYLNGFVRCHLAHMVLWDSSITLLFQRAPLLLSHGAEDAQHYLFTGDREVFVDQLSRYPPSQVAQWSLVCATGSTLHLGWPEPALLLLWCTGAGMHHELVFPGLCSSSSVWLT